MNRHMRDGRVIALTDDLKQSLGCLWWFGPGRVANAAVEEVREWGLLVELRWCAAE